MVNRHNVLDITEAIQLFRPPWVGDEMVVLATDYDSLLSVLRQCVEAMETASWGVTVIPDVSTALAAARKILEEKKPA
jgi:hypothetical protein